MDFETIQLDNQDGIALITLNRPEVLNALNDQMEEDLTRAFRIVQEDSKIRALVMTGAGRGFCAGGDIKEMGKYTALEVKEKLQKIHRFLSTLLNLERPVIVGVNGVAAGAGFSLALCGDLLIVSEGAKFTAAFVKVGLVPDYGGLYLLPRLVGLIRAKEIFFTGRMISAMEAKEMGFVNHVVPPEDVLRTAMEKARELAQGPSVAIGMMKRILNRSLDWDFPTVCDQEALAQSICCQTDDHREGIAAFLEKKSPHFTAR